MARLRLPSINRGVPRTPAGRRNTGQLFFARKYRAVTIVNTKFRYVKWFTIKLSIIVCWIRNLTRIRNGYVLLFFVQLSQKRTAWFSSRSGWALHQFKRHGNGKTPKTYRHVGERTHSTETYSPQAVLFATEFSSSVVKVRTEKPRNRHVCSENCSEHHPKRRAHRWPNPRPYHNCLSGAPSLWYERTNVVGFSVVYIYSFAASPAGTYGFSLRQHRYVSRRVHFDDEFASCSSTRQTTGVISRNLLRIVFW